MSNFIIPLGTAPRVEGTRMGQKAAALNQLLLAGFPVPPGLCITTDAFDAAMAPFAERIRALRRNPTLHEPAIAQRTAQDIAAMLSDLALPTQLLPELSRGLPVLGNGAYAVRSSATLEDLGAASFAGHYHTALGVAGEQALAQAILTCWRSFFSAHALAAQARFAQQHPDLAVADGGMAVLIQPLIQAECAGVCFTADPVQQRGDGLFITSAWGLGAGVVDGTAPADTHRVWRLDLGLIENNIADKHTAMRQDGAAGVQPVAVPQLQRNVACLPEPWLQQVAQLGLAAEQFFGQPQDVEWAIADQQLWVLQSRPITTLSDAVRRAAHFPIAWTDAQESKHHWRLNTRNSRDRAMLLPAEIAFIDQSSSEGGQMAVLLAGGPRTRYHKFVQGRMYVRFTASTVGPGDQRIRGAALRDLFERLRQQNVTMWEHWGPEIERATQRLGAFEGATADGHALADHLEDVLAAAFRHWMIHTMMPRPDMPQSLLDMYVQMTSKPLQEAEADLWAMLQGADTAQTRLVEALYELAGVPAHDTAAWASAYARLMADYGGRFALLTKGDDGESAIPLPMPWREAPQHVLELIAPYRAAVAKGAEPPRQARERVMQAQQAKVDAACAGASPALAAAFRQQLAYYRRNMAFLDEHNHHIDQLSEGQYAQALIYAGRWLAARGDLAHPYDIFWLRPPEILTALRAAERQPIAQIVDQNKAQFEAWCRLHTPAHIGLPSAVLPERPVDQMGSSEVATPEPAITPNRLLGQAASAGCGMGPTRILTPATRLADVAAGDVLVAVNVGEDWTPIFPMLAGIVLEEGYAASHPAITAREFGVPAVFGAAQATQRIPPGVAVVVDGNTGEVTWAESVRV